MKVSFETCKSIRENSRLQSAQFGGREEEAVRNEDDCWPTPAIEVLVELDKCLLGRKEWDYGDQW
jgi:hypothetical protein